MNGCMTCSLIFMRFYDFSCSFSLECLDISTDVVTATFEADENLPQPVNDATAPIPVVDDEINEDNEEIFIVVLTVESATIKF